MVLGGGATIVKRKQSAVAGEGNSTGSGFSVRSSAACVPWVAMQRREVCGVYRMLGRPSFPKKIENCLPSAVSNAFWSSKWLEIAFAEPGEGLRRVF